VTGSPAPPGGEPVPVPEPPFVADDLALLAPRVIAAALSG
jgi:hypothetical protein